MRAPLAAGLVALALATAVLFMAPLAWQGRIYPGVSAGGVTLGGLNGERARAELQKATAAVLARPLSLVGASEPLDLPPRALGVSVDLRATAEAAHKAGRDRPVWQRGPFLIGGLLAGHDVPLFFTVDEYAFLTASDELALAVERLPTEASLVITDDGPKAIASDDGVILDREALEAEVKRAIAEERREVRLPLKTLTPSVVTEQAQQALAAAKKAFSAPVTLSYRGAEATLAPSDIAELASLSSGAALSDQPLVFDGEEARSKLEDFVGSLVPAPLDARIEVAPDGRSYQVVPARDGATVDWDAFLPALSRVVTQAEPRRLPVPTRAALPGVSTQDALELADSRRIVTFTTYFNPANTARVNNIRQVSRLLDGRLVRPGETFSFNQAVGPRTKAAGFDEAPVIVDGALTPGVGGGICQVSTTLFNAVFLAGLPVVERKAHSIYLENYPLGRDATVSWGSVDLRFKNDSSHVLLIDVVTGEQSVEVALSAISWDREVTYETSAVRDLTPPKSSAAKPRRLRDPSLPRGHTAPLEPGVDGRTIEVKRRVMKKDGSVLFEDVFLSVYRPKDYIVRVGG
jgi:vancomycin resistance protein YoaR